MSEMLAEINRIVTEDISSRVNQYDVLFEALTNSIQANATKIECKLGCYDPGMKIPDVKSVIKVDMFSIEDNGDGMTEENYSSFCKYRTKYKKALGCKGIGRFVFLKVYPKVKYKSSVVSEQKFKEFEFSLDFRTENISAVTKKIKENSTTISFERLSQEYYSQNDKIDKRIVLDLDEIKERILIHLLPTLFFYKNQGQKVNIKLIDTVNNTEQIIDGNDVPDFKLKKFDIKEKGGTKHAFSLHHFIQQVPGKLHSFYCADNRAVHEFSAHDLKVTLPAGYSGFFLLESDYLNAHLNNERNQFDIYPVRTDHVSPLSWEMINSELKTIIAQLISASIPDAKKINAEKLISIQEERPYLLQHIEESDIDMIGFLDKDYVIERAKKRFDQSKEKVLNSGGKADYSENDLREAIQLAQSELVSYIYDRAIVLERLKSLSDNKEKIEGIIHDLFMTRGSKDDYFMVGNNNLWLLDDRFTSYSYAASDKKIKEVLADIGADVDGVDNLEDEPDLALFFSHDPSNSDRLKSVMIEIKAFDYNSKPHRKKYAGLQQLREYVEAFKDNSKVKETYGFLITEVDEKFADELIHDNYTPLYSTEAPIYHRFYDKMGISLFVVSAKTLIADAEARNSVFLDIVKKQSKLNEIIDKNKALSTTVGSDPDK